MDGSRTARHYWIGLSLFWVGSGLWLLPTGSYRVFTVLAGLVVQITGSVLMVRTLLRAAPGTNETAAASRRVRAIVLGVTVAMFLVGLVGGMLVVR